MLYICWLIIIWYSLAKCRIKATTKIWTVCCTNAAQNERNKCKPFLLNGWNIWLQWNIRKGWLWLENNKYIGICPTLVTRFPSTFKSPVPAGRCQICKLYVCSSLVFKIYWYWNVKVSFQFESGLPCPPLHIFRVWLCTTYLTCTAALFDVQGFPNGGHGRPSGNLLSCFSESVPFGTKQAQNPKMRNLKAAKLQH